MNLKPSLITCFTYLVLIINCLAGRLLAGEGSGIADKYNDINSPDLGTYTGLLRMILKNGQTPVKMISSVSIEFEKSKSFPMGPFPDMFPLPSNEVDNIDEIDINLPIRDWKSQYDYSAPAALRAQPRMATTIQRITNEALCPTKPVHTSTPPSARLSRRPQGPSYDLMFNLNQFRSQPCENGITPISLGNNQQVKCRMAMQEFYTVIRVASSEIISGGFTTCTSIYGHPAYSYCYDFVLLPGRCTAVVAPDS